MTQANEQAPALPPGVDFNMQEAMQAHQLQHLLNQPNNWPMLAGCQVAVKNQLTPWDFVISGAINIYGEILYWETELDIRKIESADDFLLLVSQLHKGFDEAADLVAKGAKIIDGQLKVGG